LLYAGDHFYCKNNTWNISILNDTGQKDKGHGSKSAGNRHACVLGTSETLRNEITTAREKHRKWLKTSIPYFKHFKANMAQIQPTIYMGLIDGVLFSSAQQLIYRIYIIDIQLAYYIKETAWSW